MPFLIAGEYVYGEDETKRHEKPPEVKAENKPGHKPINSYVLPKWVYHPDFSQKRIPMTPQDYFGMAADGTRNMEMWNVAHIAAFHDDLKLLSLATEDEIRAPNKWGMTPTHYTAVSQHPYGPSLCVLHELVKLGAADPDAVSLGGHTPLVCCQRLHKVENVKKYESILLKGKKPEMYDEKREGQLRPRGKYARALGMSSLIVQEKTRFEPICLVFPGQGSQYVGMLQELQEIDSVRRLLDTAKKILEYDVLRICLSGPEEKLAQTQYCQPAMYIAGLAAIEKLKQDTPEKVTKCQAMAGLSLGEYTALTAAGVFDLETGLRVVKARAEAMEYETARPGAPKQAMLSIAGLERDVVERLCKESVKKNEVCQIANFLFPKGFSVAGHLSSIEIMKEKALEAGALQAKQLATSGAFHTPIMKLAQHAMREVMKQAVQVMKSPTCKVYMNYTGKAITPQTKPQEIADMLIEQVANPVQWEQSMRQAIKDGCTDFIECGPNKQLKAMMKRIDQPISEKMINILV